MDKFVSVVSGVGLAALIAAPGWAVDFRRTVETTVDSAYVFRGTQLAEANATVRGEVVFNQAYIGAFGVIPVGEDANTLTGEARIYGGWSPATTPWPFTYDLGFNLYIFPNSSPVIPDEERVELYGGLLFNGPLDPSIYAYYDFEAETFTTRGTVRRFIPLDGLYGVNLRADVGYVTADQVEDYVYGEAAIDVVRSFSSGFEGFFGVRGVASSEDTLFEDLTEAGPVYGESGKAWISLGLRGTF